MRRSLAGPAGDLEVKNRYHSQGLAAGGSVLLDAINKGKVHLAKFILDAGDFDIVNTRDFNGKTPLMRACCIKEEKTRDKAVMLLLSRNASVNAHDDHGRTALSHACELRCNDVVRILVRNNADPDVPDKDGNTPLIHSAMVGNDVAIEILVRSFRRLGGLAVDRINDQGLTALLIAAQNGFTECASILATEGRADVTYRDPKRLLNAEQWARLRGCSMLEVLPFSANTPRRHYLKNRRQGTQNALSSAPEIQTEKDEEMMVGEGGYYPSGMGVVVRNSKTNLKEMIDSTENDDLLSYNDDAVRNSGDVTAVDMVGVITEANWDLENDLMDCSLDDMGASLMYTNKRNSLPTIRLSFNDDPVVRIRGVNSALGGYQQAKRTKDQSPKKQHPKEDSQKDDQQEDTQEIPKDDITEIPEEEKQDEVAGTGVNMMSTVVGLKEKMQKKRSHITTEHKHQSYTGKKGDRILTNVNQRSQSSMS